MRTTLDIDDPVLAELKRLRAREGLSLGRLASNLLAQALSQTRKGSTPAVTPLRWTSKPMRPRVDLSERDALLDAMDRR